MLAIRRYRGDDGDMELAAILTGDLIASTDHPERIDAAMACVAEAAGMMAGWSDTAPRFTRFRGDGWQIRVPPGLALRAALLVAARLRSASGSTGAGLATRIAIGIGPLASTGTRDLSDAGGAAFTASGRALDRMARGQAWAIAGEAPPWAEALVALAEWHSARWSPEQAEAMAVMLAQPELTQLMAASRVGITRQAWQARLSGAGYAAWRPALRAFESGFDV